MKKIFRFILLITLIIAFHSCKENSIDEKHKIYADKYKLYSKTDTVEIPINVYIAYPDGHKTIYHIYSGKNKGNMEVWHMTADCQKCKKLSEKK